MSEFIVQAKLQKYAAAIEEAEYLEVSDLAEAGEPELQQLATTIGMAGPAARRFHKAVAALKSAAAGGGGEGGAAAAGSPVAAGPPAAVAQVPDKYELNNALEFVLATQDAALAAQDESMDEIDRRCVQCARQLGIPVRVCVPCSWACACVGYALDFVAAHRPTGLAP